MKVLLVSPGYDKQEGLGAWGYRNFRYPLIQHVSEVIDFDSMEQSNKYGRSGMEANLFHTIANTNPDILIHARMDNELQPRLLADLRDDFPITTIGYLSDPLKATCFEYGTIGLYDICINSSFTMCDNAQKVGFTNTFYLPHLPAQSFIHQTNDTQKDYDVVFIGNRSEYRAKILQMMIQSGIKLNIFGMGWHEDLSLTPYIQGYKIHEKQMEIIGKSKIILDLAWDPEDQTEPEFSARFIQACSAKAFVLSPENEKKKELFGEASNKISYTNIEDLITKVTFYLNNSQQRNQTAEFLHQTIRTSFNTEERWCQLLKQISEAIPDHKKKVSIPERKNLFTNTSHKNKITIICRVYNCEKYIDECIQSILNQTFQDFELFILDDGSTDNTAKIIQKYHHDPKVRYHYQENIGADLNHFDTLIKTSLELTDSEYVLFIDSDDIMLPEKIEKQVQVFNHDPSVDICFTDAYMMEEDNIQLHQKRSDFYPISFNSKNILRNFFLVNPIVFPTVMMKRSSIEKMGGFQTGFASDYDFWLRSAKFLNYYYLDEPLTVYRQHAESSSHKCNTSFKVQECQQIKTDIFHSYTILDFYPELLEHDQRSSDDLANAYFDLGTSILKDPQVSENLVFEIYNLCLKHQPNHTPCLNNYIIMAASCNHEALFSTILSTFKNTQAICSYPPFQSIIDKNKEILKNVHTINDLNIKELKTCMVNGSYVNHFLNKFESALSI